MEDTINTFHFGRSLLNIRILNIFNDKIQYDLLEIFHSNNLNEDYIKNKIPSRTIEEFNNAIAFNLSDKSASKKLTIKRIKRNLNKENTDDKRKISKIRAQNLTLNLLKYFNISISENIIRNPLKLKKLFKERDLEKTFNNCLKSEKKIVIIIDNYSVHKTYLSHLICKMLNIKLIYLPKYSPFLNPIEQLWRNMKNIIHSHLIPDINFLKEEIIKNFNNLVDKFSFTKNWTKKYIAKK